MKDNLDSQPKKGQVHEILAHSYLIQMFFLLLAVVLDMFYPSFGQKFFEGSLNFTIGFIFLAIGTFLIFWAQKVGHSFRKIENIASHEHFCRGPYCYTRTPTLWGILILIFGFGILIHAFFVVLCVLISFLISKFVFIKKQEKILEEKYGEHYREYKKKVKF